MREKKEDKQAKLGESKSDQDKQVDLFLGAWIAKKQAGNKEKNSEAEEQKNKVWNVPFVDLRTSSQSRNIRSRERAEEKNVRFK